MALPFAFSNNTSPTGGQLDSDLAAVAAMGIIDCTAVGTNALTLTPVANTPTVSVYNNNTKFGFTAPANSTSSVTAQVNALSALPVYLPSGSQATGGSLSNGSYYLVVYLSSLNSGNGGFLIISSIPASGAAPLTLGVAQGISVQNNVVTPNTNIDIGNLKVILRTTGGSPLITGGAVTIDLTTVGANGMDSGARPTSGWVYIYLISNGSVLAGLATINSIAAGNLPSPFPGGYSYYMYVGAMFCDGSQNLLRSSQKGRRAKYVVTPATNTAALPLMASGIAGTISATAPSWVAVAVGNFVPTAVASTIVVKPSANYNNLTGARVQIAPNNSYAGPDSTNPCLFDNLASDNATNACVPIEMELETTNIYWAAGAAGGALQAYGWTDFYVNG